MTAVVSAAYVQLDDDDDGAANPTICSLSIPMRYDCAILNYR